MTKLDAASGIYPQVVYDPEKDDLIAILSQYPTEVLLAAVQVTPRQIVLRFGASPMPTGIKYTISHPGPDWTPPIGDRGSSGVWP